MAAPGSESPWMNEELRMFRATVRQFVQKEFLPQQARWREQQRPDVEAWTQAGRTGLLLPDLPEAYGGGGGSFAHAPLVPEGLAPAGGHFGSGLPSIVGHYLPAYRRGEQESPRPAGPARGEPGGGLAHSAA